MSMESRVLALGGLAQAVQIVRKIADTGHTDHAAMRTLMGSVFALDAPDVESVYGNRHELRQGLTRLRQQLSEGNSDPDFTRLAMSVMALERSFSRNHDVAAQVREAISAIARPATSDGYASPEVIKAFARIYATHISPLKPRVMVQGNPHYLAQEHVVDDIRAVLLAALRSAVLWRQLGGSTLDFLIRRPAMAAAITEKL